MFTSVKYSDADAQWSIILKELEQGFNRLSENNIQLRKEKGELGAQLGARTAEKDALEKELAKLKIDANTTEHGLKEKLVSRSFY